MREEHKETLTRQNIILDYKNHLINSVKISIGMVFLFLSVAALWLVIALLIQNSGNLGYKFFIFFGAPVWLCLLLLLYVFINTPIKEYKEYRLLCKGKYSLVKDQLIGKEAPTPRLTLGASSVPYVFYFKSYGEYSFLGDRYYTFSKSYYMNDFSLYRSADESDTFILVVNKKNRIVFAYNTKFFNSEI